MSCFFTFLTIICFHTRNYDVFIQITLVSRFSHSPLIVKTFSQNPKTISLFSHIVHLIHCLTSIQIGDKFSTIFKHILQLQLTFPSISSLQKRFYQPLVFSVTTLNQTKSAQDPQKISFIDKKKRTKTTIKEYLLFFCSSPSPPPLLIMK